MRARAMYRPGGITFRRGPGRAVCLCRGRVVGFYAENPALGGCKVVLTGEAQRNVSHWEVAEAILQSAAERMYTEGER